MQNSITEKGCTHPPQERRENVEENGAIFEVEEKGGICFQEMAGDEMLWWGSAGV